MTDRELVMMLLEKFSDTQRILVNEFNYIEVENRFVGEDLIFDFDSDGNLISIGS